MIFPALGVNRKVVDIDDLSKYAKWAKSLRAVSAQSAKNIFFGLIWRQNRLYLQIFGKTAMYVSCPYTSDVQNK